MSENIKSQNITWSKSEITNNDRIKLKGHKGLIIWFTGLPSSGKSTIAKALEIQLHKKGKHAYILDGDNIRHGLNSDLGFCAKDREENIRRVGEVAKLFADAGIIVITSFISPYEKDRKKVREKAKDKFIEVYLKCPLEVCKKRDPKGLYKKVEAGEIENFTGISAPYEEPKDPEIILETDKYPIERCINKIIEKINL